MGSRWSHLKSAFLGDEQGKGSDGKTAIEKIGSHVSTSRAFENRVNPATYLWMIIQDHNVKLENRVKAGKVLHNIFTEAYAMTREHSDIWDKATAMAIRWAMWDRHYMAMMRITPWDRESLVEFFEKKMIPALDVVWHSSIHSQQVISQITLFYQEQPKFGGLGDHSTEEDEMIKQARIAGQSPEAT